MWASPGGLEAKVRRAKRSPERVELECARRRIECLEDELARTKLALEITGKAHVLLEVGLRERGHRTQVEAVIAEHFDDLEAAMSAKRACELLGRRRVTFYRRQQPPVLAAAGTASDATERVERRRTSTDPDVVGFAGILRLRAGAGVGGAR
jgi:hypothetical protein